MGFWDDKKLAAEKSQELALLKREAERIEKLRKEVETLRDLMENAGEDEGSLQTLKKDTSLLEKELGELEVELFLSGKYDQGGAALSVYAGAGGKDA